MAETFRGTRTLRFLWKFQGGFCPVCNTRITRITGWRIHYCVSRASGGSTNADNRVLLHPECHDRVHRQHLSVSTLHLPKEAFEGLEPDEVTARRETISQLPTGTNFIPLLLSCEKWRLGSRPRIHSNLFCGYTEVCMRLRLSMHC